MIVNKISEHINFIKLLPNIKLNEVFLEISHLDIENWINIRFYEFIILATYI